MKQIGFIGALISCLRYRKMGADEQARLQRERLVALVDYARRHSPYYRALYQSLPANFTLADLPPVNKRDLMAHWDEWVTDRNMTFAQVNAFMQNLDNVGRKLAGKYLVFSTSGSTGDPLVMLCDRTVNNVMGAMSISRGFARSDMLKSFILRGSKTIGVFATGGFYLSNGSARARLLQMPWKKKQMAITSALLPVPEIVSQLNAFQPVMLGGYPTTLELLIDEQKSGRLHIKPLIVMTGGEYLSDDLRERLSEAFGCFVQTTYSCTEGGTVAGECVAKHFHVNEDWIILEPVDREGRPVPDGVQSDKLLLTNLFNYTQPFIRYEVTDRVVMHHELCACGNPMPWLTLEGRTDDVVTFMRDGAPVRIAPIPLYATLKEVHCLRRFQLLVYPGSRIVVRLTPAEGERRESAFSLAKAALEAYLATQGVTGVSITLSSTEPRQQAGSGKFKHIIHMTADEFVET
jgi:phenylacetate-CoA ligase